MFRTKAEILEARRKVSDSFSFCCTKEPTGRIMSPRQRKMQQIPILTIHTDVTAMINDLGNTTVLRRPRMDQSELHKELQAASARLQKIKNGYPLSRVLHQPAIIYPLQHARKVAFMDEREAIKPPRTYVVPQVPGPSEFVLPDDIVNNDRVAITHNEFNKFKNQIYEDDRRRYNETVEDLNRRNRRREKSLSTEYEDLIKYGLREARRRAQRSGRLSELRARRTEEWWGQFVSEFKAEGRSPMDLVFIDMLADVSSFNEQTLGSVYREGLMKHKSVAPKLKEMIQRINDLGNVVEQYRLLMMFRNVEAQVHMDNLMANASSKV